MLNKIKSYLLFGGRFSSIEHAFKNGKDLIVVSTLKQSKNELNLEYSFKINAIDAEELKHLNNKHAVLIVNDEKVLSKSITSKQKEPLRIVYEAFPNINLDDFYFEILSDSDNHFISLSRKDYVNAILESYSKQKISIIDISLGNNMVNTVSSFINTNEIMTTNAFITLEGDRVMQIEKSVVSNNIYNINGIEVSNENLLSFSGALNSVLNTKNTETNFEDRKESLLDDYKHTRFFNLFLKFGGVFILGLLLVNFFVFNHYFTNVNALKQVSEVNQSSKQTLLLLNENVSKKQKMVDDLLKSNDSKSSFYSSEIMQSLPKTVLLSEYNFQPLQKRIKAEKAIELAKNNIIISGKSIDGKLFSSWITQLEQMNWIDKIDIIDYRSDVMASSYFTIKIFMVDDK